VTNAALVARKLGVLDDHLRRLRDRRPQSLAAFENDLLVQDAIAMSILVVVQEAMDIALHIASDQGWELATTFREAFTNLAKHGVIDVELARSLAGTANLRNRIAHGYATVDVTRIWTDLPAGIAAFERFAAAIAAFLAASAPDE
jgi:uncharacterized protein YutE (UPF0331/DUF86 family)